MDKSKITTALVILIVILLIVLFFLLVKPNKEATLVVKEESSGNITFGEGDIQAETPSAPAPSLTSVVNYNPDFPEDAKAIMEEKITLNRKTLTENPNLYESWIELGNQYKIVGDLPKAFEAWEYAGLLNPYNAVSFHNLGDVYGYYLNDPIKAEENFLKAIENAPSDSFYYIQTSEFYRLVLENSTKAKDILEQGFEKNPDSPELKKALETLNTR